MTADEIIAALRAWHTRNPGEWAFFPELRLGTGYGDYRGDKWAQRIDAWALCCWPSKGLVRVSYEIKISRSDFLRELASPSKLHAAMAVSNEFYFVAPAGMIARDELPQDCGLIEVHPDGRVLFACEAGFRDCPSPEWRFIASLCRRVQAVEADRARKESADA